MQRIAIWCGLAGWALTLGFTLPASADTAAGLAAFRNQDYQKAYREWKAAAEGGSAEAQFDLGLLYAQGKGVQRDLTEAMRWYRKSAQQGNAEAEFALGQIYSRGWGVPRDAIDAMRWLEMANSPDSEGPPLDWAQLEGYGVERDEKTAAYWYEQAARKGHAQAEFSLSQMYSSGEGVKRDEEQAARWVSASAAQGFVPAMAEFGERCGSGQGTPQNHKLAYFWLTLAFLRGDRTVDKIRTAEAAKLKPTEVAEEDHRAQNWKPRTATAAGRRP